MISSCPLDSEVYERLFLAHKGLNCFISKWLLNSCSRPSEIQDVFYFF